MKTAERADETVRGRVETLDALLKTDGGGLELVELSEDGVCRVRFTGFCTQCPMRAMTAVAIVEPALRDLAAVTDVEVERFRISDEARRRIARAVHPVRGDRAA